MVTQFFVMYGFALKYFILRNICICLQWVSRTICFLCAKFYSLLFPNSGQPILSSCVNIENFPGGKVEMRKVWPQRYVFIFCFILFDIVLALSKNRKFAFFLISNLFAYIKEKEPSGVFFFSFLRNTSLRILFQDFFKV